MNVGRLELEELYAEYVAALDEERFEDWTAFFTALPDLTATMEDLVISGDRVVGRFTYRGTHTGDYYGIPATGRAITSTVVAFDRIRDGVLVENWTVFDNYEVMRQLGIVPDDEVVS